jgi:hydroxymethylpyrimidine/phosphomethylpyrimidine kinase
MTVKRVDCAPADLVFEQIQALLEDMPPAAAKTGALGNSAVVEAVSRAALSFSFPLVVDPVMISKHGARLMSPEAQRTLVSKLLPQAALVTPNLFEAEAICGIAVTGPESMYRAAEAIRALGAHAVLIKGGHLEGMAVDVFVGHGEHMEFPAERIDTKHTHGTGCTYSAAITAELALGTPLPKAIARAKAFLTEAIRTNPGLGRGNGPVNHHARLPEVCGQACPTPASTTANS